jgi:hypothetical protein
MYVLLASFEPRWWPPREWWQFCNRCHWRRAIAIIGPLAEEGSDDFGPDLQVCGHCLQTYDWIPFA